MALGKDDRIKAIEDAVRQRAYYYERGGREIGKAWRDKNVARRSAYRAEWRRNNPDRDAASRARYEASGKRPKTDHSDYLRGWYQANKDRVKAQGRAYHKAHPEVGRAKRARRRALMFGSRVIRFTLEQLEGRLSMFGHRCWMCGKAATETDHVKALARGGPHILANLRPACLPCNRSKGARSWR